jgi:plasmid stabilization system protein ParE
MSAKLILTSEAEQDIAEAFAWYENQRNGLGEEFVNCVEACLEAIRRSPKMHAILFDNYRRGLVRRFPYGIFYEYSEDVVIVYAVFHASRDFNQKRQFFP